MTIHHAAMVQFDGTFEIGISVRVSETDRAIFTFKINRNCHYTPRLRPADPALDDFYSKDIVSKSLAYRDLDDVLRFAHGGEQNIAQAC